MRKSKFAPVYLTLVLIALYLPIVVVVLYSFNANTSRFTFDFTGFSLQHYAGLLKDTKGLVAALKNSLILAGYSLALSVVLGTLGAVGMAKRSFRGMNAAQTLVTLPIMVPEIILGMAFLAFFTLLGLPFGLLTLILAHTTFCIPYIFLVVKGRLAGLDPAIGEAARDLGAGELRMFWDITLPLIAPAVVSGTLLAFAMSLDDVVISFFITGPATNTLPIKIYSQVKVGVSPEINALCTVMLLVTLALVILASRIGNGKNQKKNRMEDEL